MAYTRLEVIAHQEALVGAGISAEQLEAAIDTDLVLSYKEGRTFRLDLSKVLDEIAVAVAQKYREAGWNVDLSQDGSIIIR